MHVLRYKCKGAAPRGLGLHGDAEWVLGETTTQRSCLLFHHFLGLMESLSSKVMRLYLSIRTTSVLFRILDGESVARDPRVYSDVESEIPLREQSRPPQMAVVWH